MTWGDAAGMAARELRRRPGRAVLTVLAIALAAALLTIAGTARARVLSQLSHGGSLAGISVEPNLPNPAQETLDSPVPGPPHEITAAAIGRIRRLRDVLGVYPVTAVPAFLELRSGRHPAGFPTTVLSADLARVGALPVTLLAGRLPSPGSTVEVDVGGTYLKQIGLPTSKAARAVGTRLELETVTTGPVLVARISTVEVVGVVDEQLGSGDVVAWPALTRQMVALQDLFPRPDAPSPYVAVVVIARELSEVAAVRSQIAGIGYSTAAPVGLIVSVSRYLHVVELVLSGIGLVALAIAALGIANALLAAIRERRREIGVLKAIGARDRDVLRLFLLEAAALGILGGLAGTALGIAMAAGISANANAYLHSEGLAGVALSVPWALPVSSVAGSALVALVAGALPALRAARLPARSAVDV
jgi:hypothetical protein